jgi:DNA-directed RNA polymerase subunit M/transcription elongation factor TFIIS
MSYIHRLFSFFKKKPKEDKNSDPQETCSFCWGYQEYDEKIRLMPKEKQIDVKNHKDKYVKVGKFMVEHVDGFKNKKRIVERCSKCGGKRIRYKENP